MYHEIIEPDGLGKLIGKPVENPLTEFFLQWLVEELAKEHSLAIRGVDLDVVTVEYHGQYRAIGMKSSSGNRETDALEVEKAIEKIISSAKVDALISFAATYVATKLTHPNSNDSDSS